MAAIMMARRLMAGLWEIIGAAKRRFVDPDLTIAAVQHVSNVVRHMRQVKNIWIALAILMVLIAGVLTGQHYRQTKVSDDADKDRFVEFDESPRGRILIVLVDGTEVYCGTERAPKEAIEEYIAQTMKLNQAKSFTVCGSDTARYGDVITLIARLKKRGLRMAYIDTYLVESGTRLPLYQRGHGW